MWPYMIAFLIALVTFVYLRNTRYYGMFKTNGIFEPPRYFPFGSSYNWKVVRGEMPYGKGIVDIYWQYGRHHRYVGVFENGRPALVINDLEVAKNILIRDFDHFVDRRGMSMDPNTAANKYAAQMMFNMKGDRWRRIRSLISPAYTSGKLKNMVPFIQKSGDELVSYIDGFNGEQFNVKEATIPYSLDILAASGFGFNANSFKEPNNKFKQMVLKATGGGNITVMLNIVLSYILPRLAVFFKLSLFDEEAMSFMASVVREAMQERKKEEGAKRGDLIDLVLEGLGKDPGAIPEEQVELVLIANIVVIFFAGMDGPALGIAMTLGFLAKHHLVQEKLFQEIDDAMCRNESKEIDYDFVQSLHYLDMVVNEVFRIYFTGNMERVCTKDYKLPGSDFVVPEGMLVKIPGSAFNKDPQYWPDPHNFNPDENFGEESREKRSQFAFTVFGHGPRNCIGMRFAHLMIKMSVVKILANYHVFEGSNMPKEFVAPNRSIFNTLPVGGVWCKVARRTRAE